MNKSLVSVMILFSLFSFVSCVGKDAGHGKSVEVGRLAPDFSLKELSGRTTSLSDHRGHMILLEFWATWCPPCRATIPELNSLQARYRGEELIILGISVDEGKNVSNQLKDFAQEYQISYPVLIGNDDVVRAYGVRTIPVSFLIDKEGKVVRSYMGYLDNFEDKVAGDVDTIL